MARVTPIPSENGQIRGYRFDCPAGCPGGHYMAVHPFALANGASWDFNGDLDRPTFSPSILTRIDFTDPSKSFTCHSFVRDGKIEFLDDCTHTLAGHTVDLPDVD